MTTPVHPPITVRNIITFVDDVALATSSELATWFGVDTRYVPTLTSAARLVDGGGGTWTIPGDDYRDHLDDLAAQLDLDAEVKVAPVQAPVQAPAQVQPDPVTPSKKLAPPKYPKPVVPAQAPVDSVQMFPVDSTPEQRAQALGAVLTTGFQAGPSLTREPSQPVDSGTYLEIIPRGRSLKYTAQDPTRPGVITHYQGLPLSRTPTSLPTFKWAATDQDPQAVQDAWARSVQEMEAVIAAGGPDVDWYDTYHQGYSRVNKARARAKKGQAG